MCYRKSKRDQSVLQERSGCVIKDEGVLYLEGAVKINMYYIIIEKLTNSLDVAEDLPVIE